MKMNKLSVFLLSLVVLLATCESGQGRRINFIKMKPGGIRDYTVFQNSAEVESLARFAVQEYNKRENSILEFGRVLKAGEQVVAGKMYHLTLEAVEAGRTKIYEAKVWVKPWMNFMQLQEFKPAAQYDVPLYTSADHLRITTGH